MNDYHIPISELTEIKNIIPAQYQCAAINLKGGTVAQHYTSPGKNLSEPVKNAIYNMLVPVTSFAFGADMTGYWKNRRQNGYFDKLTEFVLVTNEHGHIIAWSGFSAITDPECTIIYNDSSGVIPPYQGQAIMGELFKLRTAHCVKNFSQKGIPLYFSTRTESPVIYKMRQRLMNRLYPNPTCPVPTQVLRHAKILAQWLGQSEKLEADSLIVRNAYAMVTNLYGEPPSSGDANLDKWIYGQLGPADAFLLMGEVA